MGGDGLEARFEKARLNADKNEIELLVLEVNQLYERDETSVQTSCFSLANQASEILFEDDMKTLFKSKIQWRNYMFRLAANDILSINDVLFTSYTEPETMKFMKIPNNLIDRLKEEFRLHWELTKLTKSKLSPALVQFCLPIKNLHELRHMPWRVVNSRLQASSCSTNDVWFIRKLWNQQLELRKLLSDFPGTLVDEAESNGIKTVGDFTPEFVARVSEAYDLPSHQKNFLNQLRRNKSSSIVEEMSETTATSAGTLKSAIVAASKCAKEIESKRLYKALSKPENQNKLKQLSESLDLLGVNFVIDDSANINRPTLQFLRDNLRRAEDTLELLTSKIYKNDQDLIDSINNKAALNAFQFATSSDAILSLAGNVLFNHPTSCMLSKSNQFHRSKTMYCENGLEASAFQKLAFGIGLDAAHLLRDKLQPFKNDAEQMCQRLLLVSFHSYAVLSFRLEKHDLNLTSAAKDSLMDIGSILAAKEFLKEYGTHIPIGTQRIGGMITHIVEVVLPEEAPKVRVQEFATRQLQRGIDQMKFTSTGNTELVNYATQYGKVICAQCTFSFSQRGPAVADPGLFEKIIKICWHDWHLIDRIDALRFNSSLLSIWKWVQSQEPEAKKQAEYLRTAWTQMVSKHPSYAPIVNEELHSTQENQLDQTRADVEKRIETSVGKLADVKSLDKQEELFKCLEETFKNLHALKDIATEKTDENPFVKYVGKRPEFRRLLILLAEAHKGNNDSKLIEFLRRVLDQPVIDQLEANGCKLEESVKRMLCQDSKSNSSSQAVKLSDKLEKVNLENLVRYLSAELSAASDKNSAIERDVKWQIESILSAVLRREDHLNNARNRIIQVLIKKYAWSKDSFKFPMTTDAYWNMIKDIKQCLQQSEITKELEAKVKLAVPSKQVTLSPTEAQQVKQQAEAAPQSLQTANLNPPNGRASKPPKVLNPNFQFPVTNRVGDGQQIQAAPPLPRDIKNRPDVKPLPPAKPPVMNPGLTSRINVLCAKPFTTSSNSPASSLTKKVPPPTPPPSTPSVGPPKHLTTVPLPPLKSPVISHVVAQKQSEIKHPSREIPVIQPLLPPTAMLPQRTMPQLKTAPAAPESVTASAKVESINDSLKNATQTKSNSLNLHQNLVKSSIQNPSEDRNSNADSTSARQTTHPKKTYLDFLIDKPAHLVKTSPDVEMLHRLRHRMKFSFEDINKGGETLVSILMSAGARPKYDVDKLKMPSLYDTMLKMVGDYDASGVCEIFYLLLESKFMVPLYNPSTGENYSKLLRHVKVPMPPIKLPVSLGNDVGLGRVAVISFREMAESQAPELIKSLFNLESFHRFDFTRDSITSSPLTVDLGLGCLTRKPAQGEGTVNQPLVDYVLVAYITRKLELFLSFIREFADYLLIEDAPVTDGPGASFHTWVASKSDSQPVSSIFSNKTQIMLWKPTSAKLQHLTPNENFEKHGFHHATVYGPLGDKLVGLLASTVRFTVDPESLQRSSPWNERKSIRKLRVLDSTEIEELAPFDIDALLDAEVKNLSETRRSLVLQHNFRDQAAHEEDAREHRLDEQRRKAAEAKVEECIEKRKAFVENSEPSRLLEFFIEQLQRSDQCARVLTIRQLEKALGYRSDFELAEIQQRIDHYYKLSINVKNANSNEAVANKKRYIDAKKEYRESMLHMEHLWREVGHLYVANPGKFHRFPKLAAQHLMDGFSLELLDGDANLINLEWVKAVLKELGRITKKQRIFVLSVIGVQSSGKSTLLNTMFGIKMRTSVGQCTRGINMQLVPVENRNEYDYILILDTEGTRSPDFHGTALSEKRDNQMATLSILLADATIIVNPGENDAATKEILPVVLMAYQGSKLAEDNGGRLSSMMFFVYNRIDTTQKDKLTNVVQTLANSLVEAFDTVKKMGGFSSPAPNVQAQDNCLFRNFKLDTSNSTESDVRILGQNKLSFNPPNDVPDPAYGEALVELSEHIHRRTTESQGEGHQWQSRSLGELSDYVDQIWQCICSTDFNLQFATVVERSNFDQLDAEYRKCEMKFAAACVAEHAKLRQDMLKEMDSISECGSLADVPTYECPCEEIYTPLYETPSYYILPVEAKQMTTVELSSSETTPTIDEKSIQAKLNHAMLQIIKQLDEEVAAALSRRGREKWRWNYEQLWEMFKMKTMRHWRRQIKYSYDTIFKYDHLFEKFQKEMRRRIEAMFRDEKAPDSEDKLKEIFEKLFEESLNKAKREYPTVDVKTRIYQCYSHSPVIKQSTIDLSDGLIESQCVKLYKDHSAARLSSRYDEDDKSQQILRGMLKSRSSETKLVAYKLNECLRRIYEHTTTFKTQVECYDDSIVTDTIQQTDIFLKESDVPFEYTERKIAHFYARHALVHCMKFIQYQWEANNSVAAKLGQQSNKETMWQFFMMNARGAEKIKLFSLLVKNTFSSANLTEAFRERISTAVVELIKKQTWFYDIRWVNNYMDLYLVQLLDRNEVTRVLELATNPLDLYNEVIAKLLQSIASDLIRSGKEWEQFLRLLKTFVTTAHDEAMSSPGNDRARRYLERLRTSLVSNMKNETLTQRLFSCSGQEYIAIDRDSAEDFKLHCNDEILTTIGESASPKVGEFAITVSQSALQILRQENVSGVVWRCQACCPFCKSMCIKGFGHDPNKIQHDAIHQPAGIAGVRAKDQQSLSGHSCSNYAKKSLLLGWWEDKNDFSLKDWNKSYPMWAKPKQSEEWPLREYIFYKYNRELADLYGLKTCKKIPPRYKRDFAAIRKNLLPLHRGTML